MKIITDKINSEPKHSLSKSDIETVLQFIPKEYFGVKTVFKISSQLFTKSKWDRPVIENGTTYVIMSRGFERNYIIKELLIEIFIRPEKIDSSMKAHHLSKEQRRKLEELVQPIYEKVIVALN